MLEAEKIKAKSNLVQPLVAIRVPQLQGLGQLLLVTLWFCISRNLM